jgi:hypothetical protein
MLTMRERMARCIWFGYVDFQGYPNGQKTWDELDDREKEHLLYQADTIIKYLPEMSEWGPTLLY